MKILILDDESGRRTAMQNCLQERFYQYETVFFDNAKEMVRFLEANHGSALIISLDHDLGPTARSNGDASDPGTGRDVANYLSEHSPCCPIIVATTNSAAGDGMEYLLREAHWEVHRVYPWGDLEWISSRWFRTLRNAIVGSARPRNRQPDSVEKPS